MTTFELQHAAMAILHATAAEKHVLLILALRADATTRQCTPGMPRIAKDTGLSERTVHRTIAALEKAGHISREVKDGIGTIYTVHPCHGVTPDTVSPLTECHATPDTVSGKLPRTTISSTKTTSSPKKRARAVAVEVPDWVPADAWEGWLEMRRTKGAKETARALTLAIGELRKLADAGHPPGEVLDQSTFRRWTGLFPIKDTSNGLPQRNDNAAGTRAIALAGPRRGFGADMLAAALARPEDGPEGDPRDSGGVESPLPAYLRRRS
jgi:predicted DNA-binding transcriptional regulator